MSGPEAWPFSINGQHQIPLSANPFCHGQGQNRPIPDETVVLSRQTPQPGNRGPSDASRDTSLEVARQPESRARASCEGGTESSSREPGHGMTDTAPVIPPNLTCTRNSTNGASDAGTTEGHHDAQEQLSQTEAVGAPDAADVNELIQVTSPKGRATPDPGLETNARPSTERRPDEQEDDSEFCEQHTTTHSRNINGSSDARPERYLPDGESNSNPGSHHSEDSYRPNLPAPSSAQPLPDQRLNPNGNTSGASDAGQGNVTLKGASDANRRNQSGASYARAGNDGPNGAPDANRAPLVNRPSANQQARRLGRNGKSRRGASRGMHQTTGDRQSGHTGVNAITALVNRLVLSLPYLATPDTRQIGMHTWSEQLLPLIWCATSDSSCDRLRQVLLEQHRGQEALMAFRVWWVEQGVHAANEAIPILNNIARQQGVRGPPMRCYKYLQAQLVLEHFAIHSRADCLVARDLIHPQQDNGRNQSENGPDARGDDTDTSPAPPGIARNLDSAFRPEVSNPEDGGPEPDSQILLERPQAAPEQYRRREEQQVRDDANMRIQECVIWLTSSHHGLCRLEAVLVINGVGARACNTMRPWWMRHEANSPSQARAYIQGINQTTQPEEIYGEFTIQITEDLCQAGDASDLIAQDLLQAQCTQEEADRIFDEDLVNGLRDRLFNHQYWGDEEARLYNATWLTLPCHYQATLESVLNEFGIDATPFGRLNSWLLQQGLRNPRDMPRRLDDVHNDHAANRHDDTELNPRIECLLRQLWRPP